MKKLSQAMFFQYLTVCYVVLLILSNVMASRLVSLGPWVVDAGNITYPLIFMVGDLISDIFGFRQAKKVIYTGFIFNFIFVAFTWVGTLFTQFDNSPLTLGYDALFAYNVRIVVASFICYIIGSLLNAGSLIWIKKITGEKLFAVRTIGSTAIGAVVDTVLFSLLAWVGQIPMKDIMSMALVTYVLKMIYEGCIATPVAYALKDYIKSKVILEKAK